MDATAEDSTITAEDVVPETDATLEDGAMPEESAVPAADATPEDGAMPEVGLRVKLAEGFVRKPVDVPVPAS